MYIVIESGKRERVNLLKTTFSVLQDHDIHLSHQNCKIPPTAIAVFRMWDVSPADPSSSPALSDTTSQGSPLEQAYDNLAVGPPMSEHLSFPDKENVHK